MDHTHKNTVKEVRTHFFHSKGHSMHKHTWKQALNIIIKQMDWHFEFCMILTVPYYSPSIICS